MQAREPLVMCLTNTVAANFTANCLIAVGARPIMVEELAEAEELAGAADALLVNLGTVTEQQAKVMFAAVRIAREHGTPWVLDPVGVQLLSFRRTVARELIDLKPSLIRGNHAETGFLGDTRIPTLSTGKIDHISDAGGHVVQALAGGTPLLQSVTATGCAQGGICAACLGRGQSPLEAALSASNLMKRAGECAARKCPTPGSFQPALIDALWELTHD